MDRRGFLSGMIALAAAPAIVRADSLMRIFPMDAREALLDLVPTKLIIPPAMADSFAKILWPGVANHWAKHYAAVDIGKAMRETKEEVALRFLNSTFNNRYALRK